MFIRWRKYHTIDELNIKSFNPKPQRGSFKIAIIDDETFTYEDQLRKLGFQLDKYDDVDNFDMLSAYSVIISDIKGVGKQFNSEFEGAFILKELKKKYPFKAFAAYTGSSYDIRINAFLSGIQVIKKDSSIDLWSEAIDSLINSISNPKLVWNKMRKNLLDKDVSLLELEKLEDEFVDRILNHDGDFNGFPSKKTSKGISSDAIETITALSAGVIKLLIAK